MHFRQIIDRQLKSLNCGQIHAPFIQLYRVIPSQAGLNESGPDSETGL